MEQNNNNQHENIEEKNRKDVITDATLLLILLLPFNLLIALIAFVTYLILYVAIYFLVLPVRIFIDRKDLESIIAILLLFVMFPLNIIAHSLFHPLAFVMIFIDTLYKKGDYGQAILECFKDAYQCAIDMNEELFESCTEENII